LSGKTAPLRLKKKDRTGLFVKKKARIKRLEVLVGRRESSKSRNLQGFNKGGISRWHDVLEQSPSLWSRKVDILRTYLVPQKKPHQKSKRVQNFICAGEGRLKEGEARPVSKNALFIRTHKRRKWRILKTKKKRRGKKGQERPTRKPGSAEAIILLNCGERERWWGSRQGDQGRRNGSTARGERTITSKQKELLHKGQGITVSKKKMPKNEKSLSGAVLGIREPGKDRNFRQKTGDIIIKR